MHAWTGYSDSPAPGEMYVTDYTKNPLLPFDCQKGPTDHQTIKISLWDKPKEFAQDMQPGYYRLRGVVAKMDKSGSLEGKLGGRADFAIQRVTDSLREVRALIAQVPLLYALIPL